MKRSMLTWQPDDITRLLDRAERALIETAARLKLPVEILRKERSVGAIPVEPTIYEFLEEMAISVNLQLLDSPLPYCAFNGGNDVFVDIGNKSLGLEALMGYLGEHTAAVPSLSS
jgi:IMP and pyridine-specific 5'-nucleotidase